MKTRLLAAAALILAACNAAPVEENLTQYVDPRIGSGGHGHVFVGASVPFGMVQLGPTSIPQEWDWTSGYHASDSTVIGFSHTHLEGTGIGDLFDVTLMPVVGDVVYARGDYDGPETGLWSYADRSREIARPGYYSVPLTRWGITAELTATARVDGRRPETEGEQHHEHPEGVGIHQGRKVETKSAPEDPEQLPGSETREQGPVAQIEGQAAHGVEYDQEQQILQDARDRGE